MPVWAFFTCPRFVICSMIKQGRKGMKYFSSSLIAYFVCVNAGICAYLPVVDVSRGGVSARAAFGEEIVPEKTVAVAPVQKKEKKVVARVAKKTTMPIASTDVLKPNRPSSDLWARNTSEVSLRMPRMDEISVIKSEALLPEESLMAEPVKIAEVKQQPTETFVQRDEALNELKQLRAEVARLAKMQQESQIANARPITVRTPIAGVTNVAPKEVSETAREVNVRRNVVSMDTPKQIASRSVNNVAEPKTASVKNEMTKMTPNELKKAFKKTYLSENKHLSTYQIDDKFDAISDMSFDTEGFTAARDLSEMEGGVRPMEIKISFLNGDSGLSRDNYDILTQTASIVVNNPKRAIQIAIPESATHTKDARKLAAKRLAIVEQVLRDTGIADQRIVPVLSQRDDDVFVLRVISGDTFESLREQKRNMFGDTVSTKTYKSMSW